MANQWAGEEMWSRSTDEPFELQVMGGRERVRVDACKSW